jgi:hypothetical protein
MEALPDATEPPVGSAGPALAAPPAISAPAASIQRGNAVLPRHVAAFPLRQTRATVDRQRQPADRTHFLPSPNALAGRGNLQPLALRQPSHSGAFIVLAVTPLQKADFW